MDQLDPMSYLMMLEDAGQLESSFTPFQGQDALLQQQMAQAQALRQKTAAPRNTAGGAIGSGLGALGNQLAGTIQSNQVQGKQEQLLGAQQDEATQRMRAVIEALKNKQGALPRPGVGATPGGAAPAAAPSPGGMPMMNLSVA